MGVPTIYWSNQTSGETYTYASVTSGCATDQSYSWEMKNSSTDTNASQLSMYYLSIAASGDFVTNSANTIVSGGTINFSTDSVTRMHSATTYNIAGSLQSLGANSITWYERILGTGGIDGKATGTYRWGKVLNYTYS
ncbi:MAG: hypothetical protein ACXAC2_00165 [Candidatus Kariarchaeaceae archaeon]|jgi:hypothetical protein